MKELFAWLDDRTGYRKLTRSVFYDTMPGGASWRRIWGATLVFALVMQAVTGLFLWLAYSPSAQTAWESVYFVQYRMTGGWLLRGLHHYTADAIVVLLTLHLVQVVVTRAYRAPRELTFWVGLGMLSLSLSLALTGYLLPWDRRGYCATRVATSLMGVTPVIGPHLQRIALGGTEYGHHTLTRFFALHAGILPLAMALMVGLHLHLVRRHGRTPLARKRQADCAWWPDQGLKDAIACLAVLAAILLLVTRPVLTGGTPGAHLGAPADPTDPFASFDAARPEWYFLFLFQLLKYFPGTTEVWGALVLPAVAMTLISSMPWFDRWQWGHRFNLCVLGVLLVSVATLAALAIDEDRHKPEYQAAVRDARIEAERARELADLRGIPSSGAATLLHEDPLTEGPKLFARNCAICHRYGGTDGLGHITGERQTASDLKGFASRQWLAGLIDPRNIGSTSYMGGSAHRTGEMVRYVNTCVRTYTPEKKAQLLQVIAAVSAEAQLPRQRGLDVRDAALVQEGRRLLADGKLRCTECHQFHARDEDTIAPDLTGYGSREWQVNFITNPTDSRFYGKHNDRMPTFGKDKVLSAHAIGLIADWIRGDWLETTAEEPPES